MLDDWFAGPIGLRLHAGTAKHLRTELREDYGDRQK